MREAAFWRSVKKGLEEAATTPIHLVRVENLVGAGTPDVNGCYKGVEFWIELKSGSKVRTTQTLWAINRAKAGGDVFLLEKVKAGVFLSRIINENWVVSFYWKKLNYAELLSELISLPSLFDTERKAGSYERR